MKILIPKAILFSETRVNLFSESIIKAIDDSNIKVLIPIVVPIECATVICVPCVNKLIDGIEINNSIDFCNLLLSN